MRAKSLLAAAAALALGACSANAAFTVSAQVTPGTGPNDGRFLVRFFALGNGTSAQILGVDARLNIVNQDGTPGGPGSLIFRKAHLDEDDVLDYDVLNYNYGASPKVITYDSPPLTRTIVNTTGAPNSTEITSFIRPQGKTPDEYTVNLATSIDPANPESNPTFQAEDTDFDGIPEVKRATIVPGAVPNPAYDSGLKSFRVAGAYTSGIPATSGQGVLIALAFVEAGTGAVQLQFNYPGDPNNGGIGDQSGTRFKPNDLIVPIPEPTSLTVLSLGAIGFLARRRRA